MEAPKEPARRKDASREGTPSIPPVPVDTPAGPPPPSKQGKPPGRQRRPLSTRARILAGVGVALILLLIVPIAVNLASTPVPGAIITTPPPTGKVVFQDDFAAQKHGWEDAAGDQFAVGDYNSGAYRISLDRSDVHAMRAPVKASSVYPSAPESVRVDVKARVLAGGQDIGYGIMCRAGQSLTHGYAFLIKRDYLEIAETYDQSPYYQTLAQRPLADLNVNVSTEYRLQATCRSDKGQPAVHLAFWVNGGRGLEVIDTEDPIPTGTVGLMVQNAVEAEFDDFVVRQI
jgi:hypothetical protein